MRYVYVVGFVFVLALGVTPAVGCGDDAETLTPELFGTWVFVNAEENGMSWGEECVTDCDVLTFKADGRFVLAQPLCDRRFDGTLHDRNSTCDVGAFEVQP